MFMRGSLLLLMTLLTVLAPSASRALDSAPAPEESGANATKVILTFGSGGYPPFFSESATEPEFTGQGLFVELLDVFEAENPQWDVRRISLPRRRQDRALAMNEAHVFCLHSPLFLTAGERSDYLFTDPIYRTGDHVITLPGSDLEFHGPEDLAGHTVGLVLGYGYGPLEQLLEQGRVWQMRVSGEGELMRVLERGRVDAVVGNRHVAPYQRRLLGLDPEGIVIHEPPLYEFDLVLVVRPERRTFVEDFNAFLAKPRTRWLMRILAGRWLGVRQGRTSGLVPCVLSDEAD